MGWCSATYIFDAAVEAAYELQRGQSLGREPVPFPNPVLVRFAKTMRDILEDGDWDCQNESDYWEDLAQYLWPDSWEEYLRWND